MGKFSRRDFLKAAAAGAGAMTLSAFLEACGKVLPTSVPPTDTQHSSSGQPTKASLSQPSGAATKGRPSATDTVPAPTESPVPIPDIAVTMRR